MEIILSRWKAEIQRETVFRVILMESILIIMQKEKLKEEQYYQMGIREKTLEEI